MKSAVIAKLFLLATIKFATRDAYGMGIEYEGVRKRSYVSSMSRYLPSNAHHHNSKNTPSRGNRVGMTP